jgi:transketolase
LAELGAEPLPVIVTGQKLALFATGSMVKVCMNLIQQGLVEADLFSVPVLKAASKAHFNCLKSYAKAVTVEEHSVYGGLGDMVASAAAEFGTVRVKKIGVEDHFSKNCGTYNYLMHEHGLDSEAIAKKILNWI